MISQELLQSFIAEASDLLDDAEPSLIDYSRCEEIDDRTEIVNRVFRHFHSIKGSAGFVGMHNIASLTHEAETLLEQYRKAPERVIPQQDINLLCRTVDLLRAIFTNAGEASDAEGNDLGLSALIEEIVTATKAAKTANAAERTSLSSLSEPVSTIEILDEKANNPEETHMYDQKSVEEALSRVGQHVIELNDNEVKSASTDETGADETKPQSVVDDASEKADLGKDSSGVSQDTVDTTGSDTKSGSDAKSSGVKSKKNRDTTTLSRVQPDTSTKEVARIGPSSPNTARLVKGGKMTRQEKLSTGDFAERYATEANELLEQIEQSLLQAEQHPESSADAVQEALRCLHSFKGNSGFMNLSDLERLSHRMEAEVESHTGRSLGLDTQMFDALLQMIDVLRQGVHDFSIGGSGRIPETDAYIEMMDEFAADQYGGGGTQYRRSPTAPGPDAIPGISETGDLLVTDDNMREREKKDLPTAVAPRQPSTKASTSASSGFSPKPARSSSDTTRMVLVGNASTQVNLTDAPKAQSIVLPSEPATGNDASGAPSGAAVPPQSTSGAARKSASKPVSDTTQKRRSADLLAARNDIRVDLRKLDSMLDLVGELVIAEAMVTRHPVVWNAENESLERAVHQLRRVASSLQDMATSVRMIPLAPTFRRMTRLVYDLSVKAGKQVDLFLLGEDTEVDRTVIERISDPLVHIIRNAIDHGIETPEERRELGKPETGRLTIEGHHEGGEVWIVVTDDGRGLNRETILTRAISRGLVQGDGSDLSDREVYQLIFEPGFSTANRVTDISGRGFGMDVVKKNVEKLSGKIDIQARPGEGMAVVMRIPLTLAIIDGMLVSSGENRYIIPLLSIRESLRPEVNHIVTTPDGQEVLKLRGELIPIVKLGETFSRESAAKNLVDGILMIVEGEEGDVVALFADELIGQQETVIKGLSGWLKKSRGVSGCTILGDGEVGLILDIGAIVRMSRGMTGDM